MEAKEPWVGWLNEVRLLALEELKARGETVYSFSKRLVGAGPSSVRRWLYGEKCGVDISGRVLASILAELGMEVRKKE